MTEEGVLYSHRALIGSIIKHLHIRPQDAEDAMQEGRIGLVVAWRRFDPKRGVRFTTFATSYVRGTILHWIQDNRTMLKAPRYVPMESLPVVHSLTGLATEEDRIEQGAEDADLSFCALRVDFERALRRLPERQRQAFMWYLQDIPTLVVARRLNVSQQGARYLIERARRTLRARMSA